MLEHHTTATASLASLGDPAAVALGGVKRAAATRLAYELGVSEAAQWPAARFDYLTRIHYSAENVPADGVFGEHEIDYVLVARESDEDQLTLKPNENEVECARYFDEKEVRELLAASERASTPESSSSSPPVPLVTPWFKMIAEKFLFHWWANLDDLAALRDHKNIHKFLSF